MKAKGGQLEESFRLLEEALKEEKQATKNQINSLSKELDAI